MPGDKDYGAEGSTKVYRFTPGVDNVVSVLDERHFMHGKVNVRRYDLEEGSEMSARNLALADSIREHGVEQPGIIWWNGELGHIISGTRRWNALELANTLRRADEIDPFAMRFEVNSRWDETTAREKWRRANQDQEPNDILTRLQGAALDVERGVSLERTAEVWDFSESQLRRALRPGGILEATDELKEALALGAVKLPAALRLCGLSKEEQRVALKTGATPKAKNAGQAALSIGKLRLIWDNIRHDRVFGGMTAGDLLGILIDHEGPRAQVEAIDRLLTASAMPGPKPRQPALPGTDGLTADERETTQRFLDQEAEKREAAEAA